MATKKMKPDEEAITEILVADTDTESGAEVSDVEEEFEEEEEDDQQEEEEEQLLQQASAQNKPQAATSGGLSAWAPPQGRNTNIHPFVGPAKGVKKSETPYINKDRSPLSVLMLFFTEIFHLLIEQTNVNYQQHLDKLDLAADCLKLHCRT